MRRGGKEEGREKKEGIGEGKWREGKERGGRGRDWAAPCPAP